MGLKQMKNKTTPKIYYIRKGIFKDGRRRIVILNKGNGKSKALPKPEKLLEILEAVENFGYQNNSKKE